MNNKIRRRAIREIPELWAHFCAMTYGKGGLVEWYMRHHREHIDEMIRKVENES